MGKTGKNPRESTCTTNERWLIMHKRKTDKELEAFVSADKYVRGLVETFAKIELPARAADIAGKLSEYIGKSDDPMYSQAAILTWAGYGMQDIIPADDHKRKGIAANFIDGALKYASGLGFNPTAVISIGAIIDSVYKK